MKYYQVSAKCGHVGGPGKYILIDFYTVAESGKDAAAQVRQAGRVKHDHKDAIRDVREVSYAEYCEGWRAFNADPYNRCHNPQEQRLVWDQIAPRVQEEITEDDRCRSRKKDTRHRAGRYGCAGYGKGACKRAWDYEECA